MIDMPTQHERRHRVPTTVEQFWLVPVLPSSDIEPSALYDGETNIGSESTCEIFLPVPGVDGHHCSIRVDNDRAILTAHSRMTWVNDGPVRRTVIKPGQRLAIGPVEFRLERRPQAQSPDPVDPVERVETLQRVVREQFSEKVGDQIGKPTEPSLRDDSGASLTAPLRPRPAP